MVTFFSLQLRRMTVRLNAMKNFMYLLFVVLLLSGCDSKQQLTGKVTFSDGEPLTVGTVVFSTPTFISRANIGSGGTFNVGTNKEGDGIPPGTYKVFVIGAEVADPKDSSGMSMLPIVAKEFTSESSTPLTVTIPGTKTFDIVVERHSAKK
jgi:hypothetical protein